MVFFSRKFYIGSYVGRCRAFFFCGKFQENYKENYTPYL